MKKQLGIWPDINHTIDLSVLAEIEDASEQHEAQGGISIRIIELLKESGYFGLPIPTHLSGQGTTLAECAHVQKKLGYYDPGLAVGLNMHLFTMGIMIENWQRTKDMSWMMLKAIAEQKLLVASAFAEPHLGGSLLRSYTKAKKAPGGGYHLNGLKVPCSIAGRADMFCMQAQTDEPRADRYIVALVPASSPGLEVKKGRPLFGMKSSESDMVSLTDCYIPESLILHRTVPGTDETAVFKASLVWFCLTASAIYLGAVARALDYVTNRLSTLKLPPSFQTRADDPLFQAQLGQCYYRYSSCDLSCAGLANFLSTTLSVDESYLPAALAVKQQTYEMVTNVMSTLVDLTGASEYTEDGLLMKLYRDIQACRYHPPTPLITNKVLGEILLGKPVSFDGAAPRQQTEPHQPACQVVQL